MYLHRGTLVAIAFGAVGGLHCGPDEEAGRQPNLELHAFPAKVSPGGESTLAIVVRDPCLRAATCTLCVALMPTTTDDEPGHLFSLIHPSASVPAGQGGSPNALSIAQARSPNATTTEPITIVYSAPNQEGARVVSAALFDGADACTSTADKLRDSRTVRIEITKDAAPASGGAAGTGGTGGAGTGGTPGAAGGAVAGSGGSS